MLNHKVNGTQLWYPATGRLRREHPPSLVEARGVHTMRLYLHFTGIVNKDQTERENAPEMENLWASYFVNPACPGSQWPPAHNVHNDHLSTMCTMTNCPQCAQWPPNHHRHLDGIKIYQSSNDSVFLIQPVTIHKRLGFVDILLFGGFACLFLFLCGGCFACIYIYTPHTCSAHRSQKREMAPLKLE